MGGITRRQFIKLGTMSAGAVAVGSGLTTRWWGLEAHEIPDPRSDGDRVIPTFCEVCFWKCGVLAHVKEGRVTKLTGNPKHPLSRGRLCPRGYAATGLLYDPDRLKQPLVRMKKRGEEVFAPVSWEEALGRVAEGMAKIRDTAGPEALALFSHGFGGSWFAQLMKAYGSPNIGAPSYAQCRGPREAGYGLTFGSGLGSPEPIDLENARVITLIGSHLGENMHNTQVQELAEAIGRGAELVVVDPRYSTVAGKARYWLPIKPGTDIALLLAWMNVIVEEKRYDEAYLQTHAIGFDELKRHVADKTPDWAYPLTGIRPEVIRETARFIAAQRPASLVHPGRHSTWYGDDTQRARAMAILAALLGSWGRRGGYLAFSKMDLPPYPGPKPGHASRSPVDKPKAGGFPFADELLAQGLRDATAPGAADYPITGWIVYGSNLLYSLPGQSATIEAIQRLDLLVTIDVLPTEIAGWSDVVLPESTYLERHDDIWAAPYKQPFLALRQQVVPPLYDSRPGWWIARELGQHLGLGDFFPWRDARDYLQKRIALAGLDWKELESTGVILGPKRATCVEDGLKPTFATDSGKIELYSAPLAKTGFEPLPVFYPPEEPPAGTFRLLTGRSPLHTFSATANNRLSGDCYPENEVWVNTTAARSLPGFPKLLATGDRVMLVNQDGVRSGPVKVKVTERIRGDCVYLVHGWGHTAKGLTRARGRGASDSALMTRYRTDPIMGGTGMNVNYVRLERAETAS
jgi:thiosulfate reductase/polysulfide reductase chain A